MSSLLAKLHTNSFVLDLKNPIDSVPTLPGYAFERIDKLTIAVDVPKNQSINGLFNGLSRQGIEVVSMRNKSNRLEQMFMDLINNTPPP